jgi:hypothetical protein
MNLPTLLLALLAFSAPVQDSPVPTATPKTEVFVLGMIHSQHRTSELWGLDQVRHTLRSIDPDLICVEIPPENWPGTLATWKAEHVVTDSRARVFPEYVDVLMPLTDELKFKVAACAGWTREMAVARQARIQLFNTSEADAVARGVYEVDDAWSKAWVAAHPAPAPSDDPFYIHSPAYDLRSKVELGSYEHHLNEVIGWPGGWTYINNEHFALVREAIEANPGKRIVVTFGGAHKYWFMEQLRAMQGVEVMDVRPFLPGGPERPLSLEQRAAEELLIGIDSLRAYWSDSRGTTQQAWTRVEAMLAKAVPAALVTKLKAARGTQASEFKSGPFLGAVEVEPRGAEGIQLRIEVRRLGDKPGDAQWLQATLLEDAERPGGFAWTRLVLPAWLLR